MRGLRIKGLHSEIGLAAMNEQQLPCQGVCSPYIERDQWVTVIPSESNCAQRCSRSVQLTVAISGCSHDADVQISSKEKDLSTRELERKGREQGARGKASREVGGRAQSGMQKGSWRCQEPFSDNGRNGRVRTSGPLLPMTQPSRILLPDWHRNLHNYWRFVATGSGPRDSAIHSWKRFRRHHR